jgi:mRNA interferase RelE/StbE
MNKLPRSVWTRVIAALQKLADNPRQVGAVKLRSRPGYRIRVGEYRAIYLIDDRNLSVFVESVRHRKDAYR